MVFELIDEICNVLEANAFHAGLDEVFIIGDNQCPRCAGKDKATLFAGEVTTLYNHLAKQTSFYLGDKYNNFFRYTKKNVFKNFPKKEKELNEYLKTNNVNFDKEEDLVRLLAVLKD